MIIIKKIIIDLKKILIVLLIILFICFLYISNIIKNKSNYKLFKRKNLFKLKKLKNYNNTINEAAENAKEFIFKSSNGLLLNSLLYFKLNNNPKVSVIIPIRNREKTIKRALRSIQNQNMYTIEIILVNDFSVDNTSNIIKTLNNEDSRIKVINNKKHMGTLYSRSIGVLLSNGKYIFPLDSDDMFLSEDVLNVVYEEAEENNFDIVSFKGITVWNLNNFFIDKDLIEFRKYKKDFILQQPELGDNAVGKYILYGKCIKNKIYKKATKAYGKKRYCNFITYLEDAIINYIICQFAKKDKYILKYGILVIRSKYSDSHYYNEIKRNIFRIKYIEVLFEFSRNSFKAKKRCVSKIISLLKNKYLYKSLKDKKIRKFFIILIKRIILSKYISKKSKKLIINYLNILKKLLNN